MALPRTTYGMAGSANALSDGAARLWHLAAGCSFPLPFVPKRSYKDRGSGFGTPRPAMGPGILHPACDLEAPVGTPVLAVDDGEILQPGSYYFYLGTYAIEVRHRYFIARYGEIKDEPITNWHVKKGDVIGHIGNVGQGYMLHFEMFAGTETGYLTVHKPPWNRRKDLLDPTPFLDLWALGTPSQNK